MNRYPYRLNSPQWDAKLSPFWVWLTRPLRRRFQLRTERLLEIKIEGLERLRSLVDQGAGVLITCNHAGHADPFVMYEAADQLGRPFYFMTAWQVFVMGGPIRRWLLRRHGCFSVEREGADLRAFKRGVEILAKEPNPLVIFPEGEVYHVNDRITPIREGTAVIALTAIKHTERPVYLVPSALKYRYIDDPTPELEAAMAELEQRIGWRPKTGLPLPDRIYKFAEAALSLKEIEYMDATQQGPLPQRIKGLIEHILSKLERTYGLTARDLTVPERVKSVRRACLEKLESLNPSNDENASPAGGAPASAGRESPDPALASEVQSHLEDVFFVVQLFSYPGDYVVEKPTVERLAETIDKFEEDALNLPTARIRGSRRALLTFGEPIDVRKFAEGAAQPRKAAGPLTDKLERAIQGLLDGINQR